MTEKHIRILFLAVEDYPPRRVDVVQLFFVELASRGIDCIWYLRNKYQHKPASMMHLGQRTYVAKTCPIGGIIGKLINKLIYLLGDICFTVTGARSVDIIQLRDKYWVIGFALIVALLTNRKVVYWCSYPFPEHSCELASIERYPVRSFMYQAYGKLAAIWLYRFIMPRMDHVFVQSEQMLEEIAERGVAREKMTAVPMGVPRSLLEHAHPARSVRVVPDRIVYLGSLGRARRLETLIDAFALVTVRVPKSTLVMVGDGDVPADRARLDAYVRDLGLSDRVEFTGQLPSDAAWQRVGEAAVCVSPIYPSPTLRQGSPTKLFEYMALGKPTVANDHPEQSKVLAESGAGLCVPWDAQAFADAICDLLDNPERAAAMAARGPGWIAANRTYDLIADMVYAKYQHIVGAA